MTGHALFGIGCVIFGVACLLFAIWRGFEMRELTAFGLKLELPRPVAMPAQRVAAVPALVALVLALVLISTGFFRIYFPAQVVDITIKPAIAADASSSPSSINETVRFVNTTGEITKLYWIGFDGTPEFWADISPGSNAEVATFSGHVWSVKTESGAELLRYVVKTR